MPIRLPKFSSVFLAYQNLVIVISSLTALFYGLIFVLPSYSLALYRVPHELLPNGMISSLMSRFPEWTLALVFMSYISVLPFQLIYLLIAIFVDSNLSLERRAFRMVSIVLLMLFFIATYNGIGNILDWLFD